MNINSLMDSLAAALASNAAIIAWVASEYDDATHKVFVGRDDINPPSQADVPCFVIYPEAKSVGRSRASKEHVVMVETWLEDDSYRVNETYDNIIEKTGSTNVEAMRKLAETACAAVDTGGVVLADVEIAYDTISMYPLFFAVMALTFRQESVAIGEDRLA